MEEVPLTTLSANLATIPAKHALKVNPISIAVPAQLKPLLSDHNMIKLALVIMDMQILVMQFVFFVSGLCQVVYPAPVQQFAQVAIM